MKLITTDNEATYFSNLTYGTTIEIISLWVQQYWREYVKN